MSLQTEGVNYLSLASAPATGNTVHVNVRFSTITATPTRWHFVYSVSDIHFGKSFSNQTLYFSATPNTNFFGSQTINNNQWYAVTWTWDGTTDRLYINGVLEISTTAINTGSRLTIDLGRISSSLSDIVNFDGLKIWQAVLTPEEIRNEIHSIKPKRWQDLWAWLPCNNGAAIGADYSGNGRSFTQTGTVIETSPSSTAWGDSPIVIPQANTSLIYYQSPLMLLAC